MVKLSIFRKGIVLDSKVSENSYHLANFGTNFRNNYDIFVKTRQRSLLLCLQICSKAAKQTLTCLNLFKKVIYPPNFGVHKHFSKATYLTFTLLAGTKK